FLPFFVTPVISKSVPTTTYKEVLPLMTTSAPAKARLYFLDNLRSFIILLVIAFHVSLGYMFPPLEWWYVIDIKQSLFFTAFVMLVDVFIMPTMFLIAGYFTVPVLQRGSVSAFFRNKINRIVLPWIAGVLLLAPAITYMIWFSRSATPPAYLFFWQTMFFTPKIFNQAHYWFLGLLFYFYLLAVSLYRFRPALLRAKAQPTDPTVPLFLGFGAITATTFWLATLVAPADLWFNQLYVIAFQPSRLLLYLAYFLLGIHAWRNAWFTAAGYRPSLRQWSLITLLFAVIFLLYRLSFPVPPTSLLKAGHAVLHSFFCLGMVFTLLAFFQHKMNGSGYLWRRLSLTSYTIYYIHQAVVLPVAYAAQKLDMAIAAKYLLVSAVCLLATYLTAEIIIRIKSLCSTKLG
ncbi:MAG TPA: acyltransferase family protein, partial [Patescibacteria group bacterium]|nr:acyltransferase family protein [Patescibacteria group bacterium]